MPLSDTTEKTDSINPGVHGRPRRFRPDSFKAIDYTIPILVQGRKSGPYVGDVVPIQLSHARLDD